MDYDYSILIDHFPESVIEEFKASAINPKLCLLNAEFLNGDKSIAELLPKAKDTHDNKGSLRKGYRDRYDPIIKHGGTAYKLPVRLIPREKYILSTTECGIQAL